MLDQGPLSASAPGRYDQPAPPSNEVYGVVAAPRENLSTGSGVGSLQFIAANGDKVFTTLFGQGTPTGTPGINLIVEVNTITGGTGRFANAKGSFTVERLVDVTTGFTSGSFSGTITSPGSGH